MLRKIDMARKSSLRRDEARGGFRAARAPGPGPRWAGGRRARSSAGPLLGAALPAYGPRFPALGSGAHDSVGRTLSVTALWIHSGESDLDAV